MAPAAVTVAVGVVDGASLAAREDEVLELLGVVVLGEPDKVEAALLRACGSSGVAVPFLVTVLVRELQRDGYEAAVERLQRLALAAKARRDVAS